MEGWNFRQVRAELAKAEALKPDTGAAERCRPDAAARRAGVAPEGRFFPDTYTYTKGSSDVAVLQRALRAMDKRLAQAWEQRSPNPR